MKSVYVVIITIVMMSAKSEAQIRVCRRNLGTCRGDLATCRADNAKCNTDLQTLQQQLTTCNTNLKNLQQADQCSSNPCDVNAVCKNIPATHSCTCKAGFSGNGITCSGGNPGASGSVPGGFTDSKIIGNNKLFQSQLGRFLSPAVGQNSQWKLCYRASVYGFTLSSFHNYCDGKPDTVTIIKVGSYVFGGYTDIPWKSCCGGATTNNAFIFSLRNKEGIPAFKSPVADPRGAIFRLSTYGPTFGGGIELYISDKAYGNKNSFAFLGNSYPPPSGVQDQFTILGGSDSFTPDEWEVFYLA